MKPPFKVCVFGEEKVGWALATGRRLLLQTYDQLSEIVQLCSLEEAEIVHALWEVTLFEKAIESLSGKRVICHITNNLFRLFEQPCMIKEASYVGRWVAQSDEAGTALDALGKPFLRLEYCVDPEVFTPTLPNNLSKSDIRSKYGIPQESIVVSNFMRDSLGTNLNVPKEQKATELLVALLTHTSGQKWPLHVLLAGPRRHWLRSRLRENGVPFTFVGEEIDKDDMHVNILDSNTMNLLYHASDLHLITSRWEGGPRPLLEAAATNTPILTTPVGTAPEIVSPGCLFNSYGEGRKRLEHFLETRDLSTTCADTLERVYQRHTPKAMAEPLRHLLYRMDEVPPIRLTGEAILEQRTTQPKSGLRRYLSAAVNLIKPDKPGAGLNICLWHKFHKPPWGGGNQFMTALKGALQRLGARVTTNHYQKATHAHICNSCWFDVSKLPKRSADSPVRLIHRIDGPISLYRGTDDQEDRKIHEFNRKYAIVTVYQSAYSMSAHAQMGFDAVSPVVVHNAADGRIFNTKNRRDNANPIKIRLVTSAWSDNPRKGGPFLKWIDEALDWDRYEYTFIGRTKETFQHIKHIPAVSSKKLAQILRQHDVFISASMNEPCSNALLEGLACGCPVLYRNTGGNRELVGFAGLPFTDENDFMNQLERLSKHVAVYKSLINIRSIESVAMQYIGIVKEII